MAHFWGSVIGQRSERSAIGNDKSGIKSHIAGWSVGVEVIGSFDVAAGKDVFDVYITGGSKSGEKVLIGTYTGADFMKRRAL